MRSDLPPKSVQIVTDNSCNWATPLDGDTFNASYTLVACLIRYGDRSTILLFLYITYSHSVSNVPYIDSVYFTTRTLLNI